MTEDESAVCVICKVAVGVFVALCNSDNAPNHWEIVQRQKPSRNTPVSTTGIETSNAPRNLSIKVGLVERARRWTADGGLLQSLFSLHLFGSIRMRKDIPSPGSLEAPSEPQPYLYCRAFSQRLHVSTQTVDCVL